MNYTPYDKHTDEELVREVCNKENPTDLELELMRRLELMTADRDDWKETYETQGAVCANA